MPQQIIWQDSVAVDATSSNTPLNYDLFLPTTARIPLAGWFESATLNLRITTQLELNWIEEPKDQTFTNPTRYRGGMANFSTSGYVFDRCYLEFERQLHNYDLPPITIAGSAVALPITLARSSKAKSSHAYSIGDTRICGEIQDNPPVPPLPDFFSGVIPAGSICLKIIHGQDEFEQLERRVVDPFYSLELNLANYFCSYAVQGVVNPGFSLQAITTLYFLYEQSGVAIVPAGTPIVGDAPFPAYGFTCAFGQPVGIPLNPPCPPGSIEIVLDPNTGQNIAGCNPF